MLENKLKEIRKQLNENEEKREKELEEERKKIRERKEIKRKERRTYKDQILDFLLSELKELTSDGTMISEIYIWGDLRFGAWQHAFLENEPVSLPAEGIDIQFIIKESNGHKKIKKFNFGYPCFNCKNFSEVVSTLSVDEKVKEDIIYALGTEYSFKLLDGFFEVRALICERLQDRIEIRIHP